jgi:hypothetical protein
LHFRLESAVQTIDSELVNNFTGKRIGVSVSHLQESDGNMEHDATSKESEKSAEDWMNLNKINGKIVKVSEDIIPGDQPLLFQFDLLKENNNATFKYSDEASEVIRSELANNEIECLLLFSSGRVGHTESKKSTNVLQYIPLAARMLVAILGHTAVPGSAWDNTVTTTPGEPIFRVVIYYTCGGDRTLYLGGVEALKSSFPSILSYQAFTNAALGKMK